MILNARHRAREVALQILYRNDMVTTDDGDTQVLVRLKPLDGAHASAQDLRGHFEHFNVPEELRLFAAELVSGTLSDTTKIDGLLEQNTSNWKVSRMSVVDRSLLRMAVAELIRFPDTPASVVIDEAVELAKQFGNAESPAFINGVLDAVKKHVRS